MSTEVTLTLDRQELDQLLEGLSERAEQWEKISDSLRDSHNRREQRSEQSGGAEDEGRSKMWTPSDMESVRYRMEGSFAGLAAIRIANDYRKILDKILEQAGI
ncbi:MAG TPA: hypothetical protein DCY26_12255 [Hyphomonas sp.]|nr:hypothetical protein [Hyphomonas sp.]